MSSVSSEGAIATEHTSRVLEVISKEGIAVKELLPTCCKEIYELYLGLTPLKLTIILEKKSVYPFTVLD